MCSIVRRICNCNLQLNYSAAAMLLGLMFIILELTASSTAALANNIENDLPATATAQEAIYTPEERSAIDKLRRSMKKESLPHAYMNRDEYLITWLRARALNVPRAKEMLLKNLKWRMEEKIDDIVNEEFPQLETQLAYDAESTDKEGRPVVLIPVSKWNFRKIVLAGQVHQLFRYMTKVLFELPAQRGRVQGQLLGNNATQFYIFTDLSGYSLRQHACVQCLQIFLFYIRIYENYYPQGAKETLFINTPQIFDSIITLTRSLWSSHLTDHVQFLGYDKNEWSPVLSKYFELSQIPRQFGGTNPRKV